MKKLALTVAIVLTLGFSAMAQDGGLLNRGVSFDKEEKRGGLRGDFPGIPGYDENTDQPTPLGSGVAVLLGLGAAYLIGKKRSEE